MQQYQRHIPILKALSDETRLKIVHMLAWKSMHVNQLLECFNITQPTLSYHMKILSEADLVHSERHASHVLYSINPLTLNLVNELCATLLEGREMTEQDKCNKPFTLYRNI
ncbi:MAG: Transcriptional repressor SdpR [Firmicutes bacterium ADurb.Bin356]|nr:MAG: Transcriptional repressor SdpR [Firmicutes bacterium ADurb.Bin356]